MRRKSFMLAMTAVLVATGASAARVNIAAVVGDDVITTTDVSERRDLIMATSGIPLTVENQQKITPRIVQMLIDETLQLQEAKRQSITISDEEVNTGITELGTRSNGEGAREFVSRSGLSVRSLETQMRAQLAWNKVVQRKLRRNVSISQDEIARAQMAEASAPGEEELRIQALEFRLTQGKEDAVTKQMEQAALELKAGAEMSSVAAKLISNPNVRYSQPTWVPEKTLPVALQQGLRSLKNGEYTPPLKSPQANQILQVMDRKTAAKMADTTEYALKQITITVPKERDKVTLAKLSATAASLRANPGDCMSETLPATDIPAVANFVRVQHGAMSPEQRGVVAHMEVGDITEPLPGPDAVRIIMVCEKVEPATGAAPDAEKVRQQLYSEKLELEAQKHLRNLRRDAYIDIKGAQQ